jgi:hypothetical protein
MDPSTLLTLREIITSRGNIIDYRHNGIEIFASSPLPPIETDEGHDALFRERDWHADAILKGRDGESSIHFIATNFFGSTVEIRDMDISITRELLLCSSNFTLINCRVNASDIGEDMINVCRGSHLTLVECEVNNCRISAGTELTARAAAIWPPDPVELIYQNFCVFWDCNFSYTSPTDLNFLEVICSNVILTDCTLPNLVASSSEIEAVDCFFESFEIAVKSEGIFYNCQVERFAYFFDEGIGALFNCQIEKMLIRWSSKVSVTDSWVGSAGAALFSELKMENVTIASKTEATCITEVSSLYARNITIQRQNDIYPFLYAGGKSLMKFDEVLNFVSGESSRVYSDMIIDGSCAIFPPKVNANLFPNIFVLAKSKVFCPEKIEINVPGIKGSEFRRLWIGLTDPGESKNYFTSRRSALPPFGKFDGRIKINSWGHLLRGSLTLDDLSEKEMFFTKSLMLSKASFLNLGIEAMKRCFIWFSFRVYADACPICLDREKPCDTVAIPCGHVYHQDCYLSMAYFSTDTGVNCAICRQPSRVVGIYN